jgi:hypothetical protein
MMKALTKTRSANYYANKVNRDLIKLNEEQFTEVHND